MSASPTIKYISATKGVADILIMALVENTGPRGLARLFLLM